jgi:hypothetical protein
LRGVAAGEPGHKPVFDWHVHGKRGRNASSVEHVLDSSQGNIVGKEIEVRISSGGSFIGDAA